MNYFSKTLLITIKNLKRDSVHNIIIIIFVMIAVFFMNNSLSIARYCTYLNTIIKSSGLYETYMYVATPTKQAYYENDETDMLDEANNYVKHELDKAMEDGKIEDYFSVCQAGAPCNYAMTGEAMYFYAKYDFLKELSFSVCKGKWFDTYDVNEYGDNLIPIVVGYHFKSIFSIGQVINFDGFDGDYVVIGIMNQNGLFVSPTAGGNGTDLNTVMQNANDLIIVAKEQQDSDSPYMVKLPSHNTEAYAMDIIEKIADVVDVFTFSELADTAHKNNTLFTEMSATLAILSVITCVVGIWCGTLLSYSRGRKRQAVYVLCGMNARTSVICMILEGFLKLILPAIIGLWFFSYYCHQQATAELFIDWISIAITMLMIGGMFVLTIIRTRGAVTDNSSLNIIHS